VRIFRLHRARDGVLCLQQQEIHTMQAPSSASILQHIYAGDNSMIHAVVLTGFALEFMPDEKMSYTFTRLKDAHKLMDALQAKLDASYDELMKNSC
jgi:hypothetical protein